jgi:hypothetical protein
MSPSGHDLLVGASLWRGSFTSTNGRQRRTARRHLFSPRQKFQRRRLPQRRIQRAKPRGVARFRRRRVGLLQAGAELAGAGGDAAEGEPARFPREGLTTSAASCR